MAKKKQKKAEKPEKKEASEKKRQREKNASEEELIEDGLHAIYGKEEHIDFTKLDRKRGRLTSILITIIITLAVIAAVSWGGFFIYNKYFLSQELDTFSLEIDTRDELISGEPTTIAIRYGNPNTVPLTRLNLDIRFPSTFIITNLSPAPSNPDEFIWSVGNLLPGSDGIITIEGIWIAETPSSVPIQVLANYRPSNFNSDFQEIETVYVQTLDSTFDIEFTGPEEATPGKILTYETELKNTSSEKIEHVEFILDLPDGFFLESSNPNIDPGTSPRWKFDSMEPGESITISYTGSFAADSGGFQYFGLTAGIQDGERLLTQIIEEGFTDVLGSDLTIQLIANGGISDVSAELDENLRVTISYENTGDVAIDNLNILLDFQSDLSIPINWTDADLDGGLITSDGIIWSTDPSESLEPNEKKLLNLLLPIKSAIGNSQTDAFSLIASASHDDIEVRSTPIEVVINSEAKLEASARYYTDDGASLGNGPIPPEVGKKTTYRIFWTIKNNLHDLEDIEVTATLPPDVAWEAQAAAELGNISYNASTNTVTWKIISLPTSVERVQSNFAISITPDSDNVQKFVKLISDSLLTATDFQTEALLEDSGMSLTSELIGDTFAENKGLVIE